MHDIRIPAQHTTDLEGSMAENCGTIGVIMKIRFCLGTVNTVAAKAGFVVYKVNGNITSGKRGFVYLYPGLNGTCGYSQRGFDWFKLAAVDFIEARHYDSYIVALFSEIYCKGGNCISKSTGFCKRKY